MGWLVEIIFSLAIVFCVFVNSIELRNIGPTIDDNYDQIKQVSISMPHVRPTENDSYYCAVFRMDTKHFIVGFTPKNSNHSLHHSTLILYPSSGYTGPQIEPSSTPANIFWDCSKSSTLSILTVGVAKTIYGWAKNTSIPHFYPPGVGLPIGGDSGSDYMVLQVHYKDVDIFKNDPDATDDTGVILHLVPGDTTKIDKRVDILTLYSAGQNPSHETVHQEVLRLIDEDIEIYPLAYAIHTHGLGTVVSGYRVSTNNQSVTIFDPKSPTREFVHNAQWDLIGKADPQKVKTIQYLDEKKTNELVIKQGDLIAARCTINNTRDYDVYFGLTDQDEMCVFFLIYYVNGMTTISNDMPPIGWVGPPFYYWSDGMYVPENVDIDASIL